VHLLVETKHDSGTNLATPGVKAGVKCLIAGSALLVLLAACGTVDRGSAGGDSQSLAAYQGAWKLTSGRGSDGRVPLIADYPITLTVSGENVSGAAACNSYGGAITPAGSSFKVSVASMTEMGCADRVMRSQDAYISALSQTDSVVRDGDTLTLRGVTAELRFALLPPPPTADFVETNWRLESLIDGRGPSGVATSAHPAHLILRTDGTLRGSTGCRRLRGEWVEAGERIVFITLSASGRCPKELAPQDSQVVGVLGDGFTARIEGLELAIFAARGDHGLVYSAR
jgi:heat shock protein HslJ